MRRGKINITLKHLAMLCIQVSSYHCVGLHSIITVQYAYYGICLHSVRTFTSSVRTFTSILWKKYGQGGVLWTKQKVKIHYFKKLFLSSHAEIYLLSLFILLYGLICLSLTSSVSQFWHVKIPKYLGAIFSIKIVKKLLLFGII